MAKSPRNAFQLQFAPALIKELATRYVYEDDTEALQAGRRIASGDYSRAHLEAIFAGRREAEGFRVSVAIQTLKYVMRYDLR